MNRIQLRKKVRMNLELDGFTVMILKGLNIVHPFFALQSLPHIFFTSKCFEG
jgi:hypothetical protein